MNPIPINPMKGKRDQPKYSDGTQTEEVRIDDVCFDALDALLAPIRATNPAEYRIRQALEIQQAINQSLASRDAEMERLRSILWKFVNAAEKDCILADYIDHLKTPCLEARAILEGK